MAARGCCNPHSYAHLMLTSAQCTFKLHCPVQRSLSQGSNCTWCRQNGRRQQKHLVSAHSHLTMHDMPPHTRLYLLKLGLNVIQKGSTPQTILYFVEKNDGGAGQKHLDSNRRACTGTSHRRQGADHHQWPSPGPTQEARKVRPILLCCFSLVKKAQRHSSIIIL